MLDKHKYIILDNYKYKKYFTLTSMFYFKIDFQYLVIIITTKQYKKKWHCYKEI